jgi:uncharacterized protein YndB with AHSA1/START domain
MSIMEKLELKISFLFRASAATVWHALTDKETIRQYFFGTEATSDWKAGSKLTFTGVWEGKTYEDKGTILESQPGKKLKYSYWSSFSGTEDKPENYANITYQLEEKGDTTYLTIIQDGIANEEAREHSRQNWTMVMDGMKKIVEA